MRQILVAAMLLVALAEGVHRGAQPHPLEAEEILHRTLHPVARRNRA
jgi:hypothetical protein